MGIEETVEKAKRLDDLLRQEIVSIGQGHLLDSREEALRLLVDNAKRKDFYIWGQPVLDYTVELSVESLARELGRSPAETLVESEGTYRLNIPTDIIMEFDSPAGKVYFVPRASSLAERNRTELNLRSGAKYTNSDTQTQMIHTDMQSARAQLVSLGVAEQDIRVISGGQVSTRAGGNAVNAIEAMQRFASYPSILDRFSIKLFTPFNTDPNDPMHIALKSSLENGVQASPLETALDVKGYSARVNLEIIPTLSGQPFDRIYIGDQERIPPGNSMEDYIKASFSSLIDDSDGVGVIHSTTNQDVLKHILKYSSDAYNAGRKVIFAPTRTMMRTAGFLMKGDSIEGEAYMRWFNREVSVSPEFARTYAAEVRRGTEVEFLGAWLLNKKIRWSLLMCNGDEFSLLERAVPRSRGGDETPDIIQATPEFRVLNNNLIQAYQSTGNNDLGASLIVTQGAQGFREYTMLKDDGRYAITGLTSPLPNTPPGFSTVIGTGTAGDNSTGVRTLMEMFDLPERLNAIVSVYAGTLRVTNKREAAEYLTIDGLAWHDTLLEAYSKSKEDMVPWATVVQSQTRKIDPEFFPKEWGRPLPVSMWQRNTGQEGSTGLMVIYLPVMLPSMVSEIVDLYNLKK